jgi:hypothetical protein
MIQNRNHVHEMSKEQWRKVTGTMTKNYIDTGECRKCDMMKSRKHVGENSISRNNETMWLKILD